jgi:hypothetical protein
LTQNSQRVTQFTVAQSNTDLQTEETPVRKLETVARSITRSLIIYFIFLAALTGVITITDNKLLSVIFI